MPPAQSSLQSDVTGKACRDRLSKGFLPHQALMQNLSCAKGLQGPASCLQFFIWLRQDLHMGWPQQCQEAPVTCLVREQSLEIVPRTCSNTCNTHSTIGLINFCVWRQRHHRHRQPVRISVRLHGSAGLRTRDHIMRHRTTCEPFVLFDLSERRT